MEPAMDGLDELYMEIILDHYRDPRNRGELAPPAHMAEGFNPMCGDEIKVFLDIKNNAVKKIRIGGQGCSISQASASMMTTLIEGKSIKEVHQISKAFKYMMAIHEEDVMEDVDLGDLEALQGVVKFPLRIKCAILSWHTLEQGLKEIAASTQ